MAVTHMDLYSHCLRADVQEHVEEVWNAVRVTSIQYIQVKVLKLGLV